MKTAVVILNFNGENLLRQYLPSVITHTQSTDCEIIVADNHSSDNSLKVLAEMFPQVRVITLDQNYGLPKVTTLLCSKSTAIISYCATTT